MTTRSMSSALADVEENYFGLYVAELIKPATESFSQAYFKDYTPLLYGLIVQKIGDGALAEQALQKTFYRIQKQSDADRGRQGLLSWMLSILREVLREYPTQSFREKSLQPPAILFASGGNLAQRPELIGLNEEENTIINRLIYQNQTQAEVADELNMSIEQVRRKTRECLLKWRS
jgi:DNA-directed RNA polymerase specialized sigma24 family protein